MWNVLLLRVIVPFAVLFAGGGLGAAEIRVGVTYDPQENPEPYSEKDLLVATQVLLRNVFPDITVKCEVFREIEKLKDKVLADELDLVQYPPLEYCLMDPSVKAHFEPLLVTSSSRTRLDRFVLLTVPGTTLTQLRGQRLYFHVSNAAGVVDVWLEWLLQAKPAQYFASVTDAGRAEKAILESFFGKAEACVVREEDYTVMAELNPQLGQRLVPVACSPSIPVSLMLLRRDMDAGLKRRVIELVPAYSKFPKVMQALNLMRVSRLDFVKAEDFEGLTAMLTPAVQPNTVSQ